MSLPARDDVDPEYRFDLTRIFASPAEWEDAAATLRDRLADLRSAAEEPLESVADLRSLLRRTEDCYRRKQRLDLYATLYENVNTGDERADDLQRRSRAVEEAFEPAVAAVKRRLAADDGLDALASDLDEYRRYARNLRQQASRTLGAEAEDVAATHGEVRSAPTRVIEAVTTEDFDPPTVERPDGEAVELRYGNFRDELSHPDREYRRRVYEAYRTEMDRFEHILTRAFAEKLAAAHTEAEIRDYDSIRDRDVRDTYPDNGLEPELPGAIHETMVAAVRTNRDPFRAAQRVRGERLGVDTLRPWDLRVSIADAPEPEIPYEAATSHILDALEPLGEEYVARVRSFFDERRIDVFPTQNKRTDIPAYCPSSAADGAFVLANFRADVRTTSFLCHELGHALNVAYHSEGPTRAATCPSAVCEIPSILHELLLVEHWIDEGGPLADHARDRLLSFVGGNLYNAAMQSTFVHELAGAVEAGESLSAERIRSVYDDLLAEFRPEVEYGDRDGRDWLGWGQRRPYCSYQYVLGAVGALVVRDRLREGSLTPADYREFLRNTGQRDLLAQFETLGIDPTEPDPYERAAAAFGEYVESIEADPRD